jgi:hypothetical protein
LDPFDFLYHALTLRGQLWSLSFFSSSSFAFAPLVWGVIPTKVIFKNIIGSKWECKGYISALWKDLLKMVFPHLKLMHWGSIGLAFMCICQVIYSVN